MSTPPTTRWLKRVCLRESSISLVVFERLKGAATSRSIVNRGYRRPNVAVWSGSANQIQPLFKLAAELTIGRATEQDVPRTRCATHAENLLPQ